MTEETRKRIKQHFESNFLDGDKMPCKAITFTANGALDVAEYFYGLALDDIQAIYSIIDNAIQEAETRGEERMKRAQEKTDQYIKLRAIQEERNRLVEEIEDRKKLLIGPNAVHSTDTYTQVRIRQIDDIINLIKPSN